MEVVVVPQLAGAGGSVPSVLRYKIIDSVAQGGIVTLLDRAVNVVKLATADAVRLVLPPKAVGAARDFIARVEVTSSTAPEITFVGAEGEEVVVEDDGLSDLGAKYGANVYSFTETAKGCFFVVRKSVYPVGEAS